MPTNDDKWRLALEGLTPQGSEYHNDLERCVAHVRDSERMQHETIKDKVREVRRLESDNRRLREQVEILKGAVEQMPQQVPTSWLDPLLSGADAVVSTQSDCREIEALLRGVQDRLRSKAQAALAAIREGK